jgi:hypothetical protein
MSGLIIVFLIFFVIPMFFMWLEYLIDGERMKRHRRDFHKREKLRASSR